MTQQDFVDGLLALGHNPKEMGANRWAFEYEIPVGKFIGKRIQLGFEVASDFPATPPSGPHIFPTLLPNNTESKTHPLGGVSKSKFGQEGEDWQYWSRPFPNWASTNRSVKTYMAHIRHLFETQ